RKELAQLERRWADDRYTDSRRRLLRYEGNDRRDRIVDVHGLYRLPASPRQRNQRKTCERREHPGARAARTVHDRRLHDRPPQRQRFERSIGCVLAAEIAARTVVGTERGNLN